VYGQFGFSALDCRIHGGRNHYLCGRKASSDSVFTEISHTTAAFLKEYFTMGSVAIIPDSTTGDKHGLNAELQAFLEAFALLELGTVPKEILSKIA